MKNWVQEGKAVYMTAPVGGVVSGNAYKIGLAFGVAGASGAAGDKFALWLEGVYDLPKKTGQAWATEGLAIYWDDVDKVLTTATTSGNIKVGFNTDTATSGATTGRVRLKLTL